MPTLEELHNAYMASREPDYDDTRCCLDFFDIAPVDDWTKSLRKVG